jgi:hypothetical protein
MTRRRSLPAIAAAIAITLALTVPAGAAESDRGTLQRYAADTWASFVAMTNPDTGLPSDNIEGDLDPATRSAYTSPTNIGMYIWATLSARDLQLITPSEARQRIAVTLGSVAELERHAPSGQFYNWYDPDTLETVLVWPENGDPVYPFLSSVDNGWLASALLMVANGAVPQLRDRARELVTSMDFGFYYNPIENQIRGGYWPSANPDQVVVPAVDSYDCQTAAAHGTDGGFTCHHYGAFNTEPRIASYIGIALDQIPARHYFGGFRTFEDTCGWNWQEQRPIGEWAEYTVDGEVLRVFEGAYPYRDKLVVPSWGGSAFEAFMVPLVVPEEEWGPRSWGITHPLYAESTVEFGLEEAGYGYWGFSPASNPAGGYREYGIDYIGMEPNGYAADVERLTIVHPGWDDPACPIPPDPIDGYGQGVVTPHAAAITLDFAFDASLENLRNLEQDFPGLYGPGGFKDSVNVETGEIADRYLSLDQGMFMAAVANELRNDRLQHYFSHGAVERALRPLMAVEEFGAGRIAP